MTRVTVQELFQLTDIRRRYLETEMPRRVEGKLMTEAVPICAEWIKENGLAPNEALWIGHMLAHMFAKASRGNNGN